MDVTNLASRSLELAQSLVRMNTVSANSNLPLIHFIRDELKRLGVRSRLTHNAEKTKANLFATLGEGKPAGGGFEAVLNGGDVHEHHWGKE